MNILTPENVGVFCTAATLGMLVIALYCWDKDRKKLLRYQKLDREAATHVETVICMHSPRFTGEPPYVGWKGLGQALREDYEELHNLRGRQ